MIQNCPTWSPNEHRGTLCALVSHANHDILSLFPGNQFICFLFFYFLLSVPPLPPTPANHALHKIPTGSLAAVLLLSPTDSISQCGLQKVDKTRLAETCPIVVAEHEGLHYLSQSSTLADFVLFSSIPGFWLPKSQFELG